MVLTQLGVKERQEMPEQTFFSRWSRNGLSVLKMSPLWLPEFPLPPKHTASVFPGAGVSAAASEPSSEELKETKLCLHLLAFISCIHSARRYWVPIMHQDCC